MTLLTADASIKAEVAVYTVHSVYRHSPGTGVSVCL